MKLYIPLSRPTYLKIADKYADYPNYSAYNYMNGAVAKIKIGHFEAALQATKDCFGTATAIDYGCADGPMSLSLATYFKHTYSVDANGLAVAINKEMCAQLGIDNITHINNTEFSREIVKNAIPQNCADVLYLLETLEHVGTVDRYYESKIDFVNYLFSFLKPDGQIVITVPKMIGFSFFVQRMAVVVLGMQRDKMSFMQFLRAVFLCDVSSMEKEWIHTTHTGFNYRLLEKELSQNFTIKKRKSLFF